MATTQPKPPSGSPDEARAQLRTHFSKEPAKGHPKLWDDLWAKGDFLPWDRGMPNPALVDLLTEHTDKLGPAVAVERGESAKMQGDMAKRKKALVPGCGKGYDVLLLAAFGYDALGLEVSSNAVQVCEKFVEDVRKKENAGEDIGDFATKDENVGRGHVKFITGDFYENDWARQDLGSESTGYDLIYDYTFFCAMPPDLRPAWALRMSQLLSSNGRLICLEFPTYKVPSTGGPPWGVTPSTYVYHLSRPGEKITYNSDCYVKEEEEGIPKTKDALVRIFHWQPNRTHEIGKGTDWVSVWSHA